MGKPGAFLDIDRVTHELRPVEERSRDFDPLYVELDDDARRAVWRFVRWARALARHVRAAVRCTT